MNYQALLEKPRRFQALTSLSPGEFDYLLEFFEPICCKYFRHYTLEGALRKHPKTKVHQGESLASSEEKLFFLLVYLKQNPTQEYHAASFGISQAKVSIWISRLSGFLEQSLRKMGLNPSRDPEELHQLLRAKAPGTLNLDASERKVQRAVDQAAQQEQYSGKKKAHTVKNNLICDDHQQILYLSPSYEGKVHDKKICDEEQLYFPQGTRLRQDTGYQGFAPQGVIIIQPKKRFRGQTLSQQDKEQNRQIAKERIVVEHAISGVKRLRILKEQIRHCSTRFRDQVMMMGCAIHNFRIQCRKFQLLTHARAHVY